MRTFSPPSGSWQAYMCSKYVLQYKQSVTSTSLHVLCKRTENAICHNFPQFRESLLWTMNFQTGYDCHLQCMCHFIPISCSHPPSNASLASRTVRCLPQPVLHVSAAFC
jgi:hypothetical protein